MVFKSILLLKSIQNLGHIGDIIRVRGGYARNFLLPNNLAIIISRKNTKYITHKKNLITKHNIIKEENLKLLSEKLEKTELTICSDITSKGRLFGSINSKDISRYLKNNNIHVDYKQIIMSNPIKYIGCHKINIELNSNIHSILTVNVTN